jgi:hypothetical protein
LIRVSEKRDVTALPLKRNLVPRFMNGGKTHKNDEGCIYRGERRVSGPLNGGKLLGLP